MAEEREIVTKVEYPSLYDWQVPILEKYGHLLNNTGGNPPAELINELQGQKGARLMQVNIVRYLLAFGVSTQVSLLHDLLKQDLLHEHTWTEQIRYFDTVRGTMVAQYCPGCRGSRRVPLAWLNEQQKEEKQ